jgi:hypothetical protein
MYKPWLVYGHTINHEDSFIYWCGSEEEALSAIAIKERAGYQVTAYKVKHEKAYQIDRFVTVSE